MLGFKENTPGLEQVMLFQGEGDHTMAALENMGNADPVPSNRPRYDDIAVLIYTSGTTGNPKGVLLSHGKYVFLAILEEEIKLSSWVENAMIYGESREFIVCPLKPAFEVLEKYALQQHLTPDGVALTRDADIQQILAAEIERFLEGKFGGYEIPRKFIWLTENFSLENGMLTQTMKLKRRSVLAQYGADIEALYGME